MQFFVPDCAKRWGSRILSVTALAVAGSVAFERNAEACSWGDIRVEATFPTEGATGVPTNAVLVIAGPELTVHSIVLRDSELQAVPFTLNSVERGFDVVPNEPLAPNASYTFGVEGSLLVSFTTAAGPASAPETVAAPDVQLRQLTYEAGTCGQLATTCAKAAAVPDVYVEVRSAFGFMTASLSGEGGLYLPYGQALEGCVTAQARHVTGLRSAAIQICSDDIPTRSVVYPEHGTVCENAEVASTPNADHEGGCSMGGQQGSNETSHLGLIAIAFALGASRRSRRARPSAL